MQADDDALIVALNRSDGALDAPGIPRATYTDLITGENMSTPVAIPARGALILAN
jgi:hypothetical protein